jgi:hypothetical protein
MQRTLLKAFAVGLVFRIICLYSIDLRKVKNYMLAGPMCKYDQMPNLTCQTNNGKAHFDSTHFHPKIVQNKTITVT